MASMPKDSGLPRKKRPPARTPEAREAELVSLALDNIEQQLIEGAASSQILVQLLRMSSTRDRLEREKIANETEMIKAKRAALESQANVEELYANAVEAMRTYGGNRESI